MSYVSTAGAPGNACVFCAALSSGDDRQSLVLHRGERASLVLNAYPYACGHLLAVVTRHVAGLDEASLDELADCMRLVQIAVRALRVVYGPDGFNVGVNQGAVAGAGVAGHLHVHVVPRWNGDTSFMATIGDTKVLPESLQDTYDRLSAALRS